MGSRWIIGAGVAAGLLMAALLPTASPARAAEEINIPAGPQPRAVITALAAALKAHCPTADPSDRAALDRCRNGLAQAPGLAGLLAPTILWGAAEEGRPFWQLQTKPLERAVLLGHVLPLFMFDGTLRAERKRNEAWVVLRMAARARSPLMQDLPAPPWPDDETRRSITEAKELVLAVDPVENTVWYAIYDPAPVAPEP